MDGIVSQKQLKHDDLKTTLINTKCNTHIGKDLKMCENDCQ